MLNMVLAMPGEMFDLSFATPAVGEILALDGSGQRPMPLVAGKCAMPEAQARLAAATAQSLFPAARSPQAALAGLWLYFSLFTEAHEIAQDVPTAEGSFWHAILHRQEPDPGNAAYWFRQVGAHPVFPALRDRAAALTARSGKDFSVPSQWDPFSFIDYCEAARRKPGSEQEQLALAIQLAEWQLLFKYCAETGAPLPSE
jgi:hypothetical protein